MTVPPTDARAGLVRRLRRTVESGTTRPLEWRREQLRAMERLLVEQEETLLDALAADLGKPALEGWMTDLRPVANELRYIQAHLREWTAPQSERVRAVLQPARARVLADPLGVVLVIAPWNYPVHLLLLPMAYALAAGNTVVGKPSELAGHTAATLTELATRYLDADAAVLVAGGPDVARSLLAERWNHIFYTGGAAVGRQVAAAAAAQLTPVTLELGGKSPAIVGRRADLEMAGRRIAWGKFVNAGQTCVAPDYVVVEREAEAGLLDAIARSVRRFYGANPAASADYGRIVNDHHVARLAGLLDARGDGRIVCGGQVDATDRYVAPTVISGVAWDSALMDEEIFGPILPVLAVDDLDEAVSAINARPCPLALYVFERDRAAIRRVIGSTTSGGVAVNATLVQLAVTALPFGGIGDSGMGAYHGRAGFETFTHRKPVLERAGHPDTSLVYPPYTRFKKWLIRRTY